MVQVEMLRENRSASRLSVSANRHYFRIKVMIALVMATVVDHDTTEIEIVQRRLYRWDMFVDVLQATVC